MATIISSFRAPQGPEAAATLDGSEHFHTRVRSAMDPPEFVVFDSPLPCAFLPGRTARLPMRQPVSTLTPAQLDQRLAAGDRRYGTFLYRTQCEHCRACEPLRLDLTTFRPNATQRRMQRRGDAVLRVQITPPTVDESRIHLFNTHRDLRGLSHGDEPIDGHSYASFLTSTCCQTLEFTCWHEEQLVACAIADVGQQSLSAVYTFFSPEFKLLSLGTYCILREAEFCRETDRRYLYLGFYVAESPHMAYKSRFHPHERLVGPQWVPFIEAG